MEENLEINNNLEINENLNINLISEKFCCKKQDIKAYSPLTLAYIGDAVYELVVRSVVVLRGNRSNNNLHKKTINFVNAHTQSQIINSVSDIMTDEEKEIFKRGRNAKPYSIAKNASLGDYKRATGFEALIGYLYLTGQYNRILELVKKGIEDIGLDL